MSDGPRPPAPTPLGRRAFVKSSAALVGLGALSPDDLAARRIGGVRPIPSARREVVRTAEPIRVGVVGCGGRGSGAAAQALQAHPDVRIVAMADAFEDRLLNSLGRLTDPEAVGERAERVEVPPERRYVGFDGYRDVIADADVVILATPPHFRPVHFEAAVAAGKHVFMEKPVATDAPGIRRVLATAEQAKAKELNVVVGLQRHYQTVYREWVERIRAGMIGDVVLGRVYWNSEGVWVREREPGQSEMEYQMRNWYYFNWLCGDHIVEQHIHNIDVANWVKGGAPVRAQGQGGRLVRTGPDHGQIYDHHFVEYEYADGSRVLSQCRHMPGCWTQVSEAFHGTNGTAPRPGLVRSATGHTLFEHDDAEDPNPYQVEHDELFDAISKGEYRHADAELGAQATMTAVMGRMATYTGQPVTWEEALASDEDLSPARYAWDADPPVVPGPDGRYPVPVPGTTEAERAEGP